jgi:hypothetical protein
MFMLGGFASGPADLLDREQPITFAQQYIIMKRHGYTPDLFGNIRRASSARSPTRSELDASQIWRHPIKGIGAERLDHVGLKIDRPLPMDRAWAVLEQGGESGEGWRACRNFVRGAKGPSLMAITARVEGDDPPRPIPTWPDLAITRDGGGAVALCPGSMPIYPRGPPPRPRHSSARRRWG